MPGWKLLADIFRVTSGARLEKGHWRFCVAGRWRWRWRPQEVVPASSWPQRGSRAPLSLGGGYEVHFRELLRAAFANQLDCPKLTSLQFSTRWIQASKETLHVRWSHRGDQPLQDTAVSLRRRSHEVLVDWSPRQSWRSTFSMGMPHLDDVGCEVRSLLWCKS